MNQVEDSSLKPIHHLTPGIMSWGVALTAVFGAALTLVSWRKKQVLRRIRLAPVSVSTVLTVLTARIVVTLGVAVVQPMAFLSGTSFPIDAAPPWLRTVSKVFPLRHLNDGIMDFMVRGKAAGALLTPCLVLIGFTLVQGLISARVLQWEES